MSPMIEMPVEHHVFTSTSSGYSSVVLPSGADRDRAYLLERHAVYALPQRVSMEGSGPFPVKYVYFRDGELAVAARAIYLGIDATGRGGNFLYHAVFLNAGAARAAFSGPADMVVALERSGHFLGAALPDLPHALKLDDADASRASLEPDLARGILAHCFAWGPGTPPALMIGDEDAILPTIAAILDGLPPSLRWSRPFDTYAYGVEWRDLAIAALPGFDAYRSGEPPWTARIDLSKGALEWRTAALSDPIAEYLTDARSELMSRQAFQSCIDLFEDAQWSELPENLRLVDSRGVALLFETYRRLVVDRIAQTGDPALYSVFASLLSPDEFETLASTQRFQNLLAVPGVSDAVIEAFITATRPGPFPRWIVSDWAHLDRAVHRLKAIGASPAVPILAAQLIQALDPAGDAQAERVILGIIPLPATNGHDLAAVSALSSAFAARPMNDVRLRVVRAYVLGRLGDVEAIPGLATLPDSAVGLTAEPKLIAGVLHETVLAKVDVTPLLAALAGEVKGGRLASRELVLACHRLLGGRLLDEKSESRFAKSVWEALTPVSGERWAASTLAAADALRPHGLFERDRRRGGK